MTQDESQVISATVSQVLPFGITARLKDGRVGLIRNRELGWKVTEIQTVRDTLKPGLSIQVVILKSSDQQIELSLRLASQDPWIEWHSRLRIGQMVGGTVVGIQSYGVFIELVPGIVGLLHNSQLPIWAQGNIMDWFWPNDRVQVKVLSTNAARRRISLGLDCDLVHRWGKETLSQDHSITLNPDEYNSTGQTVTQLQIRTRTILVVEDDPAQNKVLENWLTRLEQNVKTVSCAEDALQFIEQEQVDLVLMDLNLQNMNGIQAIEQIHTQQPNIQCVMMTGWDRANEHLAEFQKLYNTGISLLLKPILPDELLDVLLPPKTFRPMTSRILTEEKNLPLDLFASQPIAQTMQHALSNLRQKTNASAAFLFELDPTQRKISILSGVSSAQINHNALAGLIHSPVRDAAEDNQLVIIKDVQENEALVRHLKPLLHFRACLGVPVPGKFSSKYALFLFYTQSTDSTTLLERAQVTAIGLAVMLERQFLQTRIGEMHNLVLLGRLSGTLVHELNNQLNPVAIALAALEKQYTDIETSLTQSAGRLETTIHQGRTNLHNLAQGIRTLIATAKSFQKMTIYSSEQISRIDELISDVATLLHSSAKKANVKIILMPSPKLIFTRTQATQLQQILLNVMLNAIQQIALVRPKDKGRIQIQLNQTSREDGSILQISIEDDGPGIHHNLWERIFEQGYTTRKNEGSGLGLYVCRSFVESLGGRIYVSDSRMLWGTTFVIELPFRT
jgi:signal transduction histidine kinase/predicted RNA-binding protein with RPS1 domain/DNA-binding NarL/FixJ family response regulator